MSTTCLDLVLNLVILVSYLAEDAVRLKTHLFAQLYLTELRLSPPGTAAEGVAVALPVDRAAPASRGHVPFVFRRWRCCLRYHVLLQLLEEIAQQRAQETKTPVSVSMIEIGVHTASTARFLLDRAPFLHWTGIDPYEDHSGGLAAESWELSVPRCACSCCVRLSSDSNEHRDSCGLTKTRFT